MTEYRDQVTPEKYEKVKPTDDDPMICVVCGNEKELVAFTNVLVGGPGDEYRCPKCEKVKPKECKLGDHSWIFTGPNNLKCLICGKLRYLEGGGRTE